MNGEDLAATARANSNESMVDEVEQDVSMEWQLAEVVEVVLNCCALILLQLELRPRTFPRSHSVLFLAPLASDGSIMAGTSAKVDTDCLRDDIVAFDSDVGDLSFVQ